MKSREHSYAFAMHNHDYNKVVLWLGTDPVDMGGPGAEIELYPGEENEKYIITTSTAVSVPDGLAHCPLYILRADRPIILADIRPFGSPPPVPGKL